MVKIMEEMAENMEDLAETMEEMASRFFQSLAGHGLQDFLIRVRLLRLVRILRYLKATLYYAFNFKGEEDKMRKNFQILPRLGIYRAGCLHDLPISV
jgi:hypothetical protein